MAWCSIHRHQGPRRGIAAPPSSTTKPRAARLARLAFILLLALDMLGGASCGTEDGPRRTCIDGVRTDCAPLYEPTFAEVFARTLQPSCGRPGISCHSSQGAQAGLVFDDADVAYARLTDTKLPRVIAGEPACSVIVHRTSSVDPSVVMPPGRPLSEAEQCSIVRWIADGAKR